jgi:hypothetical protein
MNVQFCLHMVLRNRVPSITREFEKRSPLLLKEKQINLRLRNY